MMCDPENSYSDENGMPSEVCQKALQNSDVKECYLQDCPGTPLSQCLSPVKKGKFFFFFGGGGGGGGGR